jgi:hypothetical protein
MNREMLPEQYLSERQKKANSKVRKPESRENVRSGNNSVGRTRVGSNGKTFQSNVSRGSVTKNH